MFVIWLLITAKRRIHSGKHQQHQDPRCIHHWWPHLVPQQHHNQKDCLHFLWRLKSARLPTILTTFPFNALYSGDYPDQHHGVVQELQGNRMKCLAACSENSWEDHWHLPPSHTGLFQRGCAGRASTIIDPPITFSLQVSATASPQAVGILKHHMKNFHSLPTINTQG